MESIALVVVVGLSIFNQVLHHLERRRLINCIMSRNYTEMVQAEAVAKVAVTPKQSQKIELPQEGPSAVDELNRLMGVFV